MKSNQTVLKNVRLSFPALAEPKPDMNGNNPKFSAVFLISKSDKETLKKLRNIMKDALAKKFTDRTKMPAVLRNANLDEYVSMNGKEGWPLRDGDMTDRDGYAGHVFIKASSRVKPFTIDMNREYMDASQFYAGCYVNAAVESWAYDNTAKGVSLTLCGVQFVDDGDAFGAAPAKAEDFFVMPEGGSESFGEL